MLTPEDEKALFEEWKKYQDELDNKWNKSKDELKYLIHPKYFDFAELNDTYFSEGIVEIEIVDPKYTSYPNHEHCKEIGCISPIYIKTTDCIESHYGEESKYEGEEVEYWVWQTTGYIEDDYSGFLLLPLLDGKRFWKIRYSC